MARGALAASVEQHAAGELAAVDRALVEHEPPCPPRRHAAARVDSGDAPEATAEDLRAGWNALPGLMQDFLRPLPLIAPAQAEKA